MNTTIALLVPVVGFLVFFYGVVYTNFEANILEKNQVVADAYADLINEHMQQVVDIVDYLDALQNVVQEDDGFINQRLGSLVDNYDTVINLEILDSGGEVIFSGTDPDNIGISRAGEVFFEEAQSLEDGIYWSPPFMSTGIGDLTFNLVDRFESGHYMVVYVNIGNMSNLSQQFAVRASDDLEIAITDEYGKFISHSNIDFVNFRLREPYIEEIRLGDEASGHIFEYDGEKRSVVMERVPLTGWYVLVYQPVNSIYEVLNRIGFALASTMLVSLSIALSVGVINANHISGFVSRLSDSFNSVKSNNFEQISQSSTIHELDELTNGYNNVMTIIQERDKRLHDLAYKDSLTGYGNRLALKEQLLNCDECEQSGKMTLVFVDVTGFKVVNDVFGHDVGDGLLKYIPERLESIYSQYAARVYRLAADEFAVLISDYINKETIELLMAPLIREMKKGVIILGRKIMVSIGIGYSGIPEHGTVAKDLIQYSDIALMENKVKKEPVTSFDMNHLNQVRNRADIEANIREALEKDRFILHFQPQVKLGSRTIHGFEALIRMIGPDNKLVPPNKFIPVAEDTGLIVEMGDWILEKAVSVLKELDETHQKEFVMAVNISPIQLRHEGFTQRLKDLVEKEGINKRQLYLEVTESVLIDEKDAAYATLMTLINERFNISLDDFGTGYSSLSYLSDISFTELKIDRAFIQDVEIRPIKRNLLEAITKMGHDLGMTIVAEGIENEEQLKICREYDCDIIQGYYFARPMPGEVLNDFINGFQ